MTESKEEVVIQGLETDIPDHQIDHVIGQRKGKEQLHPSGHHQKKRNHREKSGAANKDESSEEKTEKRRSKDKERNREIEKEIERRKEKEKQREKEKERQREREREREKEKQ